MAFYTDDLPNPTIVDEEFCRWKSKWLAVPKEGRPDTIAQSLKKCHQAALPNIFTLLQLFATRPFSFCSCEKIRICLDTIEQLLEMHST